MATTVAVRVEEEALVRQAVEQVPLPKGVRLKSVRLGSDWEGEPAWRIIFSVTRGPAATRASAKTLHGLVNEVMDRVTDLQTGKFPYVNFEAPGRG